MYKWSVNWQFLPETLFLSKQFAVLLLIIQLRLLWSLANYTWYVLIDISSERKDYKPELSICAGLKAWGGCMGLGSHLLTSRKGMKRKILEMDSSRMTFCTLSSCLTLQASYALVLCIISFTLGKVFNSTVLGENCSKTFQAPIKIGIVTVCRYFHMLPFLLLRTRLSPVVAVLILLAIEVRSLKQRIKTKEKSS